MLVLLAATVPKDRRQSGRESTTSRPESNAAGLAQGNEHAEIDAEEVAGIAAKEYVLSCLVLSRLGMLCCVSSAIKSPSSRVFVSDRFGRGKLLLLGWKWLLTRKPTRLGDDGSVAVQTRGSWAGGWGGFKSTSPFRIHNAKDKDGDGVGLASRCVSKACGGDNGDDSVGRRNASAMAAISAQSIATWKPGPRERLGPAHCNGLAWLPRYYCNHPGVTY